MSDQEKEKPKDNRKVKVSAQELEDLQRQLCALQKEKADLFAKFQRLGADYDNYQKRVTRQIADAIFLEKESLVKSLLPVLDNFACALAGAGASNPDAVRQGVQIVRDQMLSTLKMLGVEQIMALGKKFDPSCHQAISQRAEPDKEDTLVLEEFQTGYKLDSRVIRPSRVAVNKLPAGQPPAAEKPALAAEQKPKVPPDDDSESVDTQ